jgi:hypothetical protein
MLLIKMTYFCQKKKKTKVNKKNKILLTKYILPRKFKLFSHLQISILTNIKLNKIKYHKLYYDIVRTH